MLALGYAPATHAFPGAKLVANVAGRPVLATVAPTPFFDPEGARMRAKVTDPPARDVRAAPAKPRPRTTTRRRREGGR